MQNSPKKKHRLIKMFNSQCSIYQNMRTGELRKPTTTPALAESGRLHQAPRTKKGKKRKSTQEEMAKSIQEFAPV